MIGSLFAYQDSDGDAIYVEPSTASRGTAEDDGLFIGASGIYLTPAAVVELRDALTKWLVDETLEFPAVPDDRARGNIGTVTVKVEPDYSGLIETLEQVIEVLSR